MRRNHFLLQNIFLALNSCSFSVGDSKDYDTTTTSGTSDPLVKDTSIAKDFYSKQRAQFKFRVYAFIGDLNNLHEMYIWEIFEKNTNLIRIDGDVVFIKN